MKHTGAALFPIAVMALLAAGTFWLSRATSIGGETRDGKQRHDPDYIVDHFTVRRFDTGGKLQHFLVGEKMLHFPDDDSTMIVSPKLTYFRTPPVRASSNQAWLDKDGKHVKLEGDVHVIREGLNGEPPTMIATEVLYAVPDDDLAHTDAPVVITRGQSVLRGSGLESNNKTQISTLYGRATGTIFPRAAAHSDKGHGKR